MNTLVTLFDVPPSGQWDTQSGANPKPTVAPWQDNKTLQIGSADYVIIKIPESPARPFALYNASYLQNLPIVIQINSATSSSRADQIVNEVVRIITNNGRLSGYIDLIFDGIQNNSIEQRQRWEYLVFARSRKDDDV